MTERYPKQIEYSQKYTDGKYEYRHVVLTEVASKAIPKDHGLLTPDEWRSLGVQQSNGWQHYTWHRPERHILLFRRPLGTDPVTGKVDPDAARAEKEKYEEDLLSMTRPVEYDAIQIISPALPVFHSGKISQYAAGLGKQESPARAKCAVLVASAPNISKQHSKPPAPALPDKEMDNPNDRFPHEILYSQKYNDAQYEFRHVVLTEAVFLSIPKSRVLMEDEWRPYCTMSKGWENYARHHPEPHILLFRRPLGTDPDTGKVDPELETVAKARYAQEIEQFCYPR